MIWRFTVDNGMYSGLLPKDLTEEELSPDEDEDEQEEDGKGTYEGKSNSVVQQSIPEATNIDNFPTCGLPGVSKELWQVCRFSYIRRDLSNVGTVMYVKNIRFCDPALTIKK